MVRILVLIYSKYEIPFCEIVYANRPPKSVETVSGGQF